MSIAVTRGGLASAAEAWQRPLLELRDGQNRAIARDVVVGPGGQFSWAGGQARLVFASGSAQIIAHGDRWVRVKNKQRGSQGSEGRDRFLAESGRTTLGVTITDESTRLDINHMTPEMYENSFVMLAAKKRNAPTRAVLAGTLPLPLSQSP